MTQFLMPPPNDYHQDVISFHLYNMRGSDTMGNIGFRIVDKLFWQSEPWRYATTEDAKNMGIAIGTIIPSSLIRPEVWDAVIFEELIQQDKEVIQLLEDLQAQDWPLPLRAKLRNLLLKIFDRDYFTRLTATTNSWLQRVFIDNPILERMGSVWQIDAKDFREGKRWSVSTLHKMSAKSAFEKHIMVVADWCMAHFSWHRDMWAWHKTILPLPITMADAEPGEGRSTGRRVSSGKSTRLTAEQERAKILAALSPAEQRNYLAAEKTRKMLARRKRNLDPEVLDILEE